MLLIAVVALLVLGPKKLPELARGIGKFLREFRRQTDDVRGVVEREFYRMDHDDEVSQPKIAPVSEAVSQGSLNEANPNAVPPLPAGLPAPEESATLSQVTAGMPRPTEPEPSAPPPPQNPKPN